MNLDQLIAELQASDPTVRAAAAEQLARAGEAAQFAAVPLVRATGDPEPAVRDWAIAALESLGPPDANSAGELTALLTQRQLDVAYWAATLLGRLGATASASAVPGVLAALISALQSHPELAVRERAAWALGRFGPAANTPEVRAALEKAAADPSPRLARLATEAIQKI